ncbi:kinase domain protein [Necator americanus]|uniref:non-specific serine/threonine protein kinase n=1 Tax=Necator americanus TaxID=51031 RepID=W2TG37_NECAM|nr:kinase domain protein [Necator americanus]ETN79982.1 kinase domain protein [Necator americanus]
MAPSGVKPGVIKDPAIAALFSNKDPEFRYDDLREIGHGSFGAVYFAFDKEAGETVAIKKMAYSGKQAGEKWADILKEVFINFSPFQLVMEYCIGSAADIVDVLRQGLREVEISAICCETLLALHYLHQLKRIHRDIKAGNILLSDSAHVKLADFGSASMTDPAQTFIGTPFFMAPEVILAMDEGHYTEKADIWSLGITCIELAERRPPLFNMNAMSALYHIAQNDPPKLAPVTNENQPEWSERFKDFVDICLRKEAEERPSTGDLLNHLFITHPEHRGVIHELISRTKAIVMELDNFQYKKMRKLMYLDEIENKDSDNTQGGGCEEVEDIVNDPGMLSVGKGDSTSSKSGSMKSLNSFRSMQSSSGGNGGSSRPPIPASLRSDIVEGENRTLIPVGNVSLDGSDSQSTRPASPIHSTDRNIRDDMATLRRSKFSTLRSAKVISREQEEYNKENNMYEQMNGYKRLRQMHHKEMQQLEERCASDIEQLRARLDKELDQMVAGYGKTRQAHEMRCFSNSQLKEYRHNKEIAKNSLKERGLSRTAYESALKDVKAQLTRQRTSAEAAFEAKLRAELDTELMKYRRTQLHMIHNVEKRLDEEDLNVLERQMDNRHAMLLRHHEATRDIELSQLKEIQTMRKRHQIIQHDAESSNQTEYTRRKTDDLRKRHAIQSRQQPRELKLKEAQIRKQFRQAVKTQTRQFKLYQTQLMQAAPKEEHKDITMQLKEKQKHRIAMLTSQYEYQIESMVHEKTGKLESWQEEEARLLNDRLSKELEQLKEYQTKQRAQLENAIDKERTALDERIALRRAMLEQRFTEERDDMQKQREARSRAIAERHAAEERQLADVCGNSSHTTAL